MPNLPAKRAGGRAGGASQGVRGGGAPPGRPMIIIVSALRRWAPTHERGDAVGHRGAGRRRARRLGAGCSGRATRGITRATSHPMQHKPLSRDLA
eukprot:6710808-Alexandrium_andersonii.AAC.1